MAVAGALMMLIGMHARADTIDNSGQAPYEQCGYCHEYDGNTVMADFPRLAGQWPAYLKKQLHDFRARRRISAQMNPTAELLSERDIDAVAEYFSAQTPRRLNLAAQSEADRRHAQQLFDHGDANRGVPACMQCHGDQGQGSAQPLVPNIAGQQPDYLQRQLSAFKSGERSNDVGAQMRRVTAQLSDKEIIQLTGYLARMQPGKASVQAPGQGSEPALSFNRNPLGQATQSLY